MGAGRESYKISTHWKYGKHKKGFKRIFNVINLFKRSLGKWERGMFIKDNITQPLDKHIGCKIFGHNYRKDYDPVEYICLKCWKRVSEQDYDLSIRKQKIQKIKSKI
jgi:hypothetical protein